MIVLTVVSFNGAPADDLSASFDELGGSIGRADGNQLVLPDPERSISRQHARVVFRSGQYAIVDNGSNPIAVNHNAVPIGREQTLWPGDLVQIGAYVLKVSQGAASKAAANPFADLFGEGDQGLAAPATPAPGSRPVDPWATPVPWNAGTAAATPMAPRPPPPPPSAPPATAWIRWTTCLAWGPARQALTRWAPRRRARCCCNPTWPVMPTRCWRWAARRLRRRCPACRIMSAS